MNTQRRRRSRAFTAFTLIELLLVLLILATLVGLVVRNFTGKSEQARTTAARTDIAAIGSALDNFEVDAGRFPETQEGLGALLGAPAEVRGWSGPYLKKMPVDPWGNPYVYRKPGQYNVNSYDLSSNGPNGQEGDADDVTNWSQQ